MQVSLYEPLYMYGPVSNASAPHKSLRFVSQHLSLLEARGDGHWAALEKRETIPRAAAWREERQGLSWGFIDCNADTLFAVVQCHSRLTWERFPDSLWRSDGLVPTEHQLSPFSEWVTGQLQGQNLGDYLRDGDVERLMTIKVKPHRWRWICYEFVSFSEVRLTFPMHDCSEAPTQDTESLQVKQRKQRKQHSCTQAPTPCHRFTTFIHISPL